MSRVDLVFNQQAAPVVGGPVRIVFGASGDGPSLPAVIADGGGSISGLRGYIAARTVAVGSGGGSITGLRGHMIASWDANVSRGARVALGSTWQEAAPAAQALSAQWQEAAPVRRAAISRWQTAKPLHGGVRQHCQEAARMRTGSSQHWQQAVPRRAAMRSEWQEASRVRTAVRALYQEAAPRRSGVAALWQETERLRVAVRSHWEDASPVRVSLQVRHGDGRPVWVAVRSHWQEAVRPAPGRSSVVPPIKQPCYRPELPARLVFFDPADATLPARLIFRCDGHGAGPEPGETIIVPLKRVYMTVHNVSAVLLPSLERVQLKGITIEANDDGYGWTLTASGPLHLMDQLAWSGGLPQRVRVTMDGIDWVFAVDQPERTRKFGGNGVQVRGHSATSLLGSDFMPMESWTNATGMTAHQLLLQALEFRGVDVDWQLTDWLVPAGGWSHTGTPLSAVQRVAEAAGAVVRSHRTEAILQVAPRFPRAPWTWASGAVDIVMPGQVMVSDGLQAVVSIPYNSVFVVGERSGSPKADVVRQGSAGDVRAAQVTDMLITDIEAARQRGISVLGNAALRYRQTITMPFLQEAKLISPGALIEVVEPSETWRGLVRGTSVQETSPSIRQTLVVERAL